MRPPCAGLFDTPMVHVNGDVTTCCLDEHLENRLGNVRETPLSTLWTARTINAWRVAHAEGRFGESGPLCGRCNWQSAGAAPAEQVEAWLVAQGEQVALRRFRERRA